VESALSLSPSPKVVAHGRRRPDGAAVPRFADA
jgi:hypothetical protein